MSNINHIHNEYYDYDRYIGDTPAVTVIREEKRKARFFHRCHVCGGIIDQGEVYNYFFIRDEESMPTRTFSSHQHLTCPPYHIED